MTWRSEWNEAWLAQFQLTRRSEFPNTIPAGVLLLSENSGQLIRAFAPGAWQECELVERGAQGYFPS